nr:MAG TPA: hypothetical protein [Caudoviricetes sp.]
MNNYIHKANTNQPKRRRDENRIIHLHRRDTF